MVGSSSRYDTSTRFLRRLLTRPAGNLLIRPACPKSKSPYNFDIVLLDHGLYFDLDDDLRINYSKFLLSLILPASPETSRDRRRFAKVVGNIDDELVSLRLFGSCGYLCSNSILCSKLPSPVVQC